MLSSTKVSFSAFLRDNLSKINETVLIEVDSVLKKIDNIEPSFKSPTNSLEKFNYFKRGSNDIQNSINKIKGELDTFSFLFSNDFIEKTLNFLNQESKLNFESRLFDLFIFFETNSKNIDFLDPLNFSNVQKLFQNKKRNKNFSKNILITPVVFFHQFFMNNIIDSPDIMIFNYDIICSSTLLLLNIIKLFFKAVPIGMSDSELKNYKKKLEKENILLLNFLGLWTIKKPEDFKEGDLTFKILKTFITYLKKEKKYHEIHNLLRDISKKFNKAQESFKFPKILLSENINYDPTKNVLENSRKYYLNNFNEIPIDELVNFINIIDLKIIFKLNKNTQDQMFKKISDRFNYFSWLLQFNILDHRNSPKFLTILRKYIEWGENLYQTKNYSSLYCLISALSIIGLIKPTPFIDINLKRKLDVFLALFKNISDIKKKMNIDIENKYPFIPIINSYLKDNERKDLKNPVKIEGKDEFLQMETLKNIAIHHNEIYEMKVIISEKIESFVKPCFKNETYYFLKKNYFYVSEEKIAILIEKKKKKWKKTGKKKKFKKKFLLNF